MLNCFCFGSSSTSIDVEGETASVKGGAYWQALPTAKLRKYTFAELKKATGDFREYQRDFYTTYKGWVDVKTLAPVKWGSGMAVTVKRCRPEEGFYTFSSQMQTQLTFLKRLLHPNVIKLLGYCVKGKEILLVYEFMRKGSLDKYILRRDSSIEPISWDARLKIAIGAARGLNFLHYAEEQVICRDFKLSNIMLDGNYNAKISEFHLALLGPTGEEMHVDEAVAGTFGYIDPNYFQTGQIHVKSDVYAFGVVLLQLLTGLCVIDHERPVCDLVEFVKPLLPHRINLKTFMDVRMEGQYSIDAAFKVAQLTLKCLGLEPETRPSMIEVVEALEKIDKMKEDAPKKSRMNLISIQQITSG